MKGKYRSRGRCPGAIPGYLCLFLVCLFSAGGLCSCGKTAGNPEKAYVAAVDAYTEQRYPEALELARTALARDKDFHQAALLEGKILFFTDRAAEAEKIFSRLASRYPAYTEARIWEIRCLILRGDHKKAQSLIETELSFNSTDWRVYYLYALLGRKTDNYELRLAMARRAESVLTDSAKVYMDLAMTWYALGMADRVREYLDKAGTVTGSNVSMAEMERAMGQFMR